MKAKSDGPARENRLQPLKLAGVVAMSIVAAWLLYGCFATPGSKAQKAAFASLGEFAADEFATRQQGGRVQVVYDVPDPAAAADPRSAPRIEMNGVQAAAFKKRLAQLGKYEFVPDVKLARSAIAMNSEWPPGAFQTLLEKPETALVLFSSLPPLEPAQEKLLPDRPGKIVVVGMSLPEIKAAVRARLVQLAVSSRVPAPPAPPGKETPAQWARRVYVVVTPETADSVQ